MGLGCLTGSAGRNGGPNQGLCPRTGFSVWSSSSVWIRVAIKGLGSATAEGCISSDSSTLKWTKMTLNNEEMIQWKTYDFIGL